MKTLLDRAATAAVLILCSCTGDSESAVPAPAPQQPREAAFYVDFEEQPRMAPDGFGYCWDGGERLGVFVASDTPTRNAPAQVELRGGDRSISPDEIICRRRERSQYDDRSAYPERTFRRRKNAIGEQSSGNGASRRRAGC